MTVRTNPNPESFGRNKYLTPRKSITRKLQNGLRLWMEFSSLSIKFIIDSTNQLGTVILNDRPLAQIKRAHRQRVDKINLAYLREDKIARFLSYERLGVPIKMKDSELYLFKDGEEYIKLPRVEWLSLGELAQNMFTSLKDEYIKSTPQLVLPLVQLRSKVEDYKYESIISHLKNEYLYYMSTLPTTPVFDLTSSTMTSGTVTSSIRTTTGTSGTRLVYDGIDYRII